MLGIECRSELVFMVCICGKWKDEEKKRIEQLASEKPFHTMVRFFPENIE